jgi:putative MATE family efflux protein
MYVVVYSQPRHDQALHKRVLGRSTSRDWQFPTEDSAMLDTNYQSQTPEDRAADRRIVITVATLAVSIAVVHRYGAWFMKDLTRGAIESHIMTLAAPVVVSMLTHTAYQLVDLYFITGLGVAATAGVNAAGSALYAVAALAQVLTVGIAPLVAQAVGRTDRVDATFVFNQALALALVMSVVNTAVLSLFARSYLRLIAADWVTADAGATYILWTLPGLALVLPMAALGAGLRGTGIVQPYVVTSMLTVVLKIFLTPVLVAGWGTGRALGVPGAGLTTSIATSVGLVVLIAYFLRSESYLRFDFELLLPRMKCWRRILALGFPAGFDFVFLLLSTAVVYYAIRDFGAATQAGFGIGSRVLQLILLPGLAIGFAVGPIAAQNFGAKNSVRVREAFYKGACTATLIMIGLAILVQCWPARFVSLFDADAASLRVAELFLQAMSWTFASQGLVYVCSNMFQGLGNTFPALLSSAGRFLFFSLAAIGLATFFEYRIEHVWYALIASTTLQTAFSLSLLRAEFKKRLSPAVRSAERNTDLTHKSDAPPGSA